MEYIIAIPSYKRAETLNNKTLKLLQSYNINKNKIFIFVATITEKEHYELTLDKYYNKVVVGEVGMSAIRNFIINYFDPNQPIVNIDDDIEKIEECVLADPRPEEEEDYKDKKNYKLNPLKDLNKFLIKSFEDLQKNNLNMWGVYPCHNAYFMKPTQPNGEHISTKLNYLIGFMYGVFNKKYMNNEVEDKEDYYRSLQFYLKDNGLIRYNNITCLTKCYTEKGGMQVERTKERVHNDALKVKELFPELCSLKTSKKTGFTELRLHDKRKDKPMILPFLL